MKLSVLALDYDGTIATDGRMHPEVRAAIADARRHGIAVALVTGRRLPELRRIVGDLSCFDVIVGENGAVLEFPASGRHVLLSHPPSATFVNELRRRGVHVDVGESVIETDASFAPAALEVLRSLEQPLTLAFNRGRLMILPQAVSKSTGLRQALVSLRLSVHNAIAVGDAENDHDLLDACEVGVAVSWGSAALRAVADEVIEGSGPASVAAYVRRVIGQPRLSAAQMGRRRLLLGHRLDGAPLELAVRGRTILIAGEPGTGKSWLAGLICEQLILQGYCLCVIDPEGDYRTLETLPGVITLGGDDPPPGARELTKALRHPDVSIIIDLSKISHREKAGYLTTLLPLLMTLRRQTGLPHKIVLDEAHYFLAGPGSEREIDPELEGYIFVTYRISSLAESLRKTEDAVVLVTREVDVQEADALLRMCRNRGATDIDAGIFRALATNEAALLPGSEEAHGEVVRFRVAPRLTSHVRHQIKYLDMPVLEDQAFLFKETGWIGPRARSLKELIGLLAALPPERLRGHMERRDFSRWLAGVFRDNPLAAHIRSLEQRVVIEDPRDLAADIAQAIRARYETTAESLQLNP